jgi:hypothetical protein
VRRQCRVLLYMCDVQAATGLVRCGAMFTVVQVVQDNSSETA